jgi:hypothetical protein
MAFRVSSLTRCQQRFVDFDRYYSGELPPIVNAVGLALLDPATMAVRDARLLNVDMPGECPWSLGYEDPRIFSFSGSLFLLVSYRNSSWRFALAVIELDPALEPHRVVAVETEFDYGLHQKNWNPFVREGQIFFVTAIAPHRIVSIDMDSGRASILHETPTRLFHALETEHDIRGGAGYVRSGDHYVGICRTASKPENSNEYMSMAYAFDAAPPFRVTGRSGPFHLGSHDRATRPLQMTTGLAELNDDFLISFGENDCDLRIARVSRERLLATIDPR